MPHEVKIDWAIEAGEEAGIGGGIEAYRVVSGWRIQIYPP
jgi:hypothetical protein